MQAKRLYGSPVSVSKHMPVSNTQNQYGIPEHHFLKVLSYNADRFNLHDKNYKSLKALANVINKVDPDIWVVQETGDLNFLQRFNEDYLKHKFKKILVSNASDPNKLAILMKDDTLYLHHTFHWANAYQQYWSNVPPDFWKSRGFLETTLRLSNRTSEQLILLNAHLKAPFSKKSNFVAHPALLKTIQQGEAKILKEIVQKELEKNPKAKILLLLDANDIDESKSEPSTASINSVWETLTGQSSQDVPASLTDLLSNSQKTAWSKNLHQEIKIDGALASPALKAYLLPELHCASVVGSFEDPDIRAASDHLPILVKIPKYDMQSRVQHYQATSPKQTNFGTLHLLA